MNPRQPRCLLLLSLPLLAAGCFTPGPLDLGNPVQCGLNSVGNAAADNAVVVLDCQHGVAAAHGSDDGSSLRVVSDRVEGLRLVLLSYSPLENGSVPTAPDAQCVPQVRAYVCDTSADGISVSPLHGNLDVRTNGRIPGETVSFRMDNLQRIRADGTTAPVREWASGEEDAGIIPPTVDAFDVTLVITGGSTDGGAPDAG